MLELNLIKELNYGQIYIEVYIYEILSHVGIVVDIFVDEETNKK